MSTAEQDLRHLIELRDIKAAEIEMIDKRIADALGPFGKEKGYMFRPSLANARKELGL